MRVVWLLCLVAALFDDGVVGELSPPDKSYKILVPIPVIGRSHWNMFKPLLEALALRGHQIVTMQPFPPKFHNPNITELVLPNVGFLSPSNQFEGTNALAGGLHLLKEPLTITAAHFYTLPEVKKYYSKRKEFDLIITDHLFNEVVYPFAVGLPFITLATPGLEPRQSAMLGNVLHPAYAPSVLKDYPFPLSFIDRLKNLFYHLYVPGYWRVWGIVPLIQKAVSTHLPDAPPLLDIEKNTSLTLLNSHFSFTKAMPLLPTQVEVGGMHCVPGKPLTQELASWVEGAGPSGVIFFSLGTVVSGNTMPVKYLNLFIEAFARLDYRFIWKFDTVLKNVSTNVLMGPYFPQQDILADHRVKLIITHGGMMSTQEAIHHATPVVAIPVFGDQPKNAMEIMRQGIGVALAWDDLTVDLIINTINEVINNPRYQRNVKQLSKRMRDQLQSPLERAVYWTEYVIRHQGAPHLKSPAAQISWVEFFMLDVLIFLLLCIIAIYLTLRKILRTVCNLFYCGVGHWKVKME